MTLIEAAARMNATSMPRECATTIPSDGDLPFSTGERGYQVDDNGSGRVMTFAQVLERARA